MLALPFPRKFWGQYRTNIFSIFCGPHTCFLYFFQHQILQNHSSLWSTWCFWSMPFPRLCTCLFHDMPFPRLTRSIFSKIGLGISFPRLIPIPRVLLVHHLLHAIPGELEMQQDPIFWGRFFVSAWCCWHQNWHCGPFCWYAPQNLPLWSTNASWDSNIWNSITNGWMCGV